MHSYYEKGTSTPLSKQRKDAHDVARKAGNERDTMASILAQRFFLQQSLMLDEKRSLCLLDGCSIDHLWERKSGSKGEDSSVWLL